MPVFRTRWLLLAIPILSTAAAAHQATPNPGTAVPETVPQVVPPIVPPVVIATPVPTLAPTPTPIATPVARPTPRPGPTATPAARATGRRAPAHAHRPTPREHRAATTRPVPIATAAASTPIPTPTMPVIVLPSTSAATGAMPVWLPWVIALAGLALVGAAWVAMRRRVERGEPVSDLAEAVPLPEPAAALMLELRPTRAGLNLISATVKAEVTITNIGTTAATAIRAELRLFSAHAEQDADLADFHAAGPIRPATPPFDLAPGVAHRFRASVALAHAAVRPIDAGGRPLFVPLMALTARFGDAAGEHRAGQAWVVGIERVDSPKLQPFWLDAPARAYENVAARPQGAAVTH